MKCIFIKEDGSNCSAKPMKGTNYCYFHNPEISEEEKKAVQSKGGKANQSLIDQPLEQRSIKSPNDVVELLEETINLVRSGSIDIKTGNCIGVLSGQILKALELTNVTNRVEIIERAIFEKSTKY